MSKVVAATSEEATDRRYINKGKTTKPDVQGQDKKEKHFNIW